MLAAILATIMALFVLAPAGSAATVPYFQALPASGNTQMTTVRWRAEATSLPSGGALLVGGFAPGVTFAAEAVNPSNNTFSALASGSVVQRADAVIAPLPNGQILIAGGYIPGAGWQQSAELYNPLSGHLTELTPSGNTELQVPRAGAIAAPTIN